MKKKVIIFKDNKLPRILTNPSEATLSKYPVDQVVRNPNLKNLKGVPPHKWILKGGKIVETQEEFKVTKPKSRPQQDVIAKSGFNKLYAIGLISVASMDIYLNLGKIQAILEKISLSIGN